LWELLNKRFTAAVASATNSVNTIVLWASALYQQGRKYTDARAEEYLKSSSEKCKACCELQPQNHEAWFLWGHVLIELGKRMTSYQERLAYFSDASEKYKRAIELRNKYIDTLWTLCRETSTMIQKIMSTREKEIPSNELERIFLAGFQLYKILLQYRYTYQITSSSVLSFSFFFLVLLFFSSLSLSLSLSFREICLCSFSCRCSVIFTQ
jgi:tetratricopeptide (TPR) repeat protein